MKNTKSKTNIQWLSYPEHRPNLGDQLVISFTNNKETGQQKIELVEWTFKTMNNSADNTNLKFKWICLPPIPQNINKRTTKI